MVYTSTADSFDGTFYVIRSGETKSITLTGIISGGANFQKMDLKSIE